MIEEQQTSPSFSGMLGRLCCLPFKVVAYVLNPCNWCNSSDEIKRDAGIALKEMRDGRPRITLHAEMLDDSKKLGMQFVTDKSGKFQSGCVTFSIPERLAGKMKKVKQKKIDALENEHTNIQIDQRNKTVLIEIDTPGIQKDIDPKKYRTFIQTKIAEEIHSSLKALMKTTGGTKIPYGDGKLINSTAKLLYDSHNYTRSEEKVISASPDRDIVVCVANKGVVSLGGYSKAQNDQKANKSSNEPESSMSDIGLGDFYIKQTPSHVK